VADCEKRINIVSRGSVQWYTVVGVRGSVLRLISKFTMFRKSAVFPSSDKELSIPLDPSDRAVLNHWATQKEAAFCAATWFTGAFRRRPHLFGWGGSRVAQIRGRKGKSSDSRWWREKKWESKNEKPRSFFPASILAVVMLSDLDTARLFMH